MKKAFVSYSNCQGGGVLHFLKKTALANIYDFIQINNWQLIVLEQSKDWAYEMLHRAEFLIYQPTDEMQCTDGSIVPSSQRLFKDLVRTPYRASFAYQFNHGLFPLIKAAPGFDGYITGKDLRDFIRIINNPADVLAAIQGFATDEPFIHWKGIDQKAYLSFDCAKRFLECLAEQARRETETDVRMVDWILANYRDKQLFLTQNHPSTHLLRELTYRLIMALHLQILREPSAFSNDELDCWQYACDDLSQSAHVHDLNEAGMNGVLPIHPAVVRELGLNYLPSGDQSQYIRWLNDMITNPDL